MQCSDGIEAQVSALTELDVHELRIRWRKLFRAAAPLHLPRYLLLRVIAYRIQANAYGDLDRETARYLERIERERVRRAGRSKAKAPPGPPVGTSRRLKPGTIMAREYEGRMHQVTAVVDGFAWNGSTYKSLSEIARLITGTHWSGPRFFGLRDRPTKDESVGESA